MNIGAARRFADRMEVQLPQSALESVERGEMCTALTGPLRQARPRASAKLYQRVAHGFLKRLVIPASSNCFLARLRDALSVVRSHPHQRKIVRAGPRDDGKAPAFESLGQRVGRCLADRQGPASTWNSPDQERVEPSSAAARVALALFRGGTVVGCGGGFRRWRWLRGCAVSAVVRRRDSITAERRPCGLGGGSRRRATRPRC